MSQKDIDAITLLLKRIADNTEEIKQNSYSRIEEPTVSVKPVKIKERVEKVMNDTAYMARKAFCQTFCSSENRIFVNCTECKNYQRFNDLLTHNISKENEKG